MSRQCVAPRCLSPTLASKEQRVLSGSCVSCWPIPICEVKFQMSINIVRICFRHAFAAQFGSRKNCWTFGGLPQVAIGNQVIKLGGVCEKVVQPWPGA